MTQEAGGSLSCMHQDRRFSELAAGWKLCAASFELFLRWQAQPNRRQTPLTTYRSQIQATFLGSEQRQHLPRG